VRAAAAALLLLGGGCGYRFAAGASLPEGIRSVCTPVYANRTAEPHLEALFAESMRERLSRAGVASGPECEARLEGEILSLSGAQTLLTPSQAVASYRVSAVVLLRLKRGRQVVAEAEVVGEEDYLPSRPLGDVLESEANRQAALRRLADDLARHGYERLAGGW